MRSEEGHGDPALDVREEREQARLQRKLTALEREVQRLIDAYQAGVIELPELQTRRPRGEDHGRVLRQRLCELDDQRHSRQQKLRVIQGLEEFCAGRRAALKSPSFDIKQKVLQLAVDRVVVDDQQLTLRHVGPTGSVRLQTGSQLCENLL